MNFQQFSIPHIHLAFIEGSLFEVKSEIQVEIFDSLNRKWKQKDYPLNGFSTVKKLLDQSDDHFVYCLLWEPENFNGTVFVTNASDGWVTLLNVCFEKYKREIINVGLSDDESLYPAYSFEKFNLSGSRIVQVIKDDDGWDFYEEGKLQPFENAAYYKKRRIADRLNNDIILEYLKTNHIDIQDEAFWRSKGNAIEFSTNLKE